MAGYFLVVSRWYRRCGDRTTEGTSTPMLSGLTYKYVEFGIDTFAGARWRSGKTVSPTEFNGTSVAVEVVAPRSGSAG